MHVLVERIAANVAVPTFGSKRSRSAKAPPAAAKDPIGSSSPIACPIEAADSERAAAGEWRVARGARQERQHGGHVRLRWR